MAFNAREQLANIPVVAHETARLAQAFRSWPQSYWSRPAYCPGWTALTITGDAEQGQQLCATLFRAY